MPIHETKPAPAGERARKQARKESGGREEHAPQFALMCGEFVDSYHASNREALAAACRKYLGTQFSILRVDAAKSVVT